ncbi:CBS domain-containing protein [Pseudomonas shirazica]|nr:CBS domain-containing protein [Pseudomonas asiatica]QUN70529.1 CBS domain-containing protein [Pseudomonas sp. JS425]UPK85915.1 CBS domain-containing protein [Pseudomonas sp. A2]UQB80381.1 CBS domain-containing protein [Pseudomonas shirazica]MBF8786545.1 CBS domain-containing protein [Pseudomonas asiatica]
MMSIGKYCNRDVVTALPSISIFAAARMMSRYHVGDLVLAEPVDRDRYRPIGLITDRDLALRIIACNPPDQEDLQAIDVLPRPLITANQNEDLFDVILNMRRANIRRIPVVDDFGLLVGIVTADDLVGLLADHLHELTLLIRQQSRREEDIRAGDI